MYGLGEPLDSLVLKVERAKKHILELEAEYDSFRKDRPKRVDQPSNSTPLSCGGMGDHERNYLCLR